MKKPKSNVSVLRPHRAAVPAVPPAMDTREERFLRGYLKLPAEDQGIEEAQANPLYVNDLEFPDRAIRPDRAIWLDLQLQKFRETGDPLIAIDIFAAAIESGIYPPVDVLRAIAAKFETWLSNDHQRGQQQPRSAAAIWCAWRITRTPCSSYSTGRGTSSAARRPCNCSWTYLKASG